MRKPTNIRKEYFIYVANKPRPKTIEQIGQKNIDNLRKVLNEITEKNELPESPELDHFITVAGSYVADTKETIVDGKTLHYKRIETPYLIGMLTSEEQNYLRFELSKSLCLFLGEKKGNLKKIKKCERCKDFFIAKDIKRKICYTNKRCLKFRHADVMRASRGRAKQAITI